MSQWTHVCGCIRIDALPFTRVNLDKAIENCFGKTINFEDPEEKWKECNVPLGSEGSVQFKVVQTGRDHDLSWGLVYIWGDLRHYADHQAIFNWLSEVCDNKLITITAYVRSCSVLVEVESNHKYLIYNKEDGSLALKQISE